MSDTQKRNQQVQLFFERRDVRLWRHLGIRRYRDLRRKRGRSETRRWQPTIRLVRLSTYRPKLEAQIVNALEMAGRLTTRQLATQLGADRSAVYSCCKRLEKEGRLKSELVKAPKRSAFFFPMTMEAVTAETHERIEHLDDAVRETVRAYSLPAQREQLIEALELQFERLAEKMAADRRSALEEFAEELLEAVATASKKGDVTSRLGMRPRYPATRIWELGQQLTLI